MQTCGDLVCPTSYVCIDAERCVAAGAEETCAGIDPGAACTVAGVEGRCADHGVHRICDPARCGDDVVDRVLHETCDGSAPIATECTDLGFDLGHPTCSADCAFDTSACTRFG